MSTLSQPKQNILAETPYLVIGGGIVGSAIAYGIADLGEQVIMLDGGDRDFKASRGNFGLVWIEGKGWNNSAYARITQQSAHLWDTLTPQLETCTGVDIGHIHTGGLNFFLNEDACGEHEKKLQKLQQHTPNFDYQFWGQDTLKKQYPHIGKEVIGAYYCTQNGIVNPLQTLYALWQGITAQGGQIKSHIYVQNIIRPSTYDGMYTVHTNQGRIYTHKVILAMGLANTDLGEKIGLDLPVRSQRGQIVVTEKVAPLLDIPSLQIRQTVEGGIMMGETHEDNVIGTDTTATGMQFITRRALRIFPILAQVNVVRCWGAMRVLTPDGLPVYAHCQNAYGVSLHSGVTMCAYHVYEYAKYIVSGQCPPDIRALSAERLYV